MEQSPQYLKSYVRGAYDLQKLRIQMGNRIVAEYKVEHGQSPGGKAELLDEEAKKALEIIMLAYRRITDGLVELPSYRKFQGDAIISSYAMLSLVSTYSTLLQQEEAQFKRLKDILKAYPIWTQWMEGVTGCGPTMAAVIISEIDIHKATYPSSLFAYAGLDVVERKVKNADGQEVEVSEGRGRRKEHLVDREYVTKDGEVSTKKSITFNPFLKTKLIGVLGTSFLKQSPEKCEYRRIYDDYKNRLVNHPSHTSKTKAHRHNMAVRYAVKIFLCHLYEEWRKLEGLPVKSTYHEGKLGIVHRKTAA